MSEAKFFAFARERHGIWCRRAEGVTRERWTSDKILKKFRFTNVFRELDRTTVWFRANVRDHLRDRPEVLLATVVFRMLNRIESGEAIFAQTRIPTPGSAMVKVFGDTVMSTAFEEYLADRDWRILRRAVKAHCGDGPYVTGAYILTGPTGKDKLDGMLWVIDNFASSEWRELARMMTGGAGLSHGMSLQTAHEHLSRYSYFGKFHSYEIVTDLRHTYLLDHAPDIMSWCNIGPGARRGINRVMGRPKGAKVPTVQMLSEMRSLLTKTRDPRIWPKSWPHWEMREVEHTLCEFDKYERVRLKQGRPRGVYR